MDATALTPRPADSWRARPRAATADRPPHGRTRQTAPHHTQGHSSGNSSPPVPSVWPRRSGRCRGSAVGRMSRSSRRWHLRGAYRPLPSAGPLPFNAGCGGISLDGRLRLGPPNRLLDGLPASGRGPCPFPLLVFVEHQICRRNPCRVVCGAGHVEDSSELLPRYRARCRTSMRERRRCSAGRAS